jgi:2-polyprenyl-3-methyl-5-hydroxy-6-metoxy-1,4-benzoquinol methylase
MTTRLGQDPRYFTVRRIEQSSDEVLDAYWQASVDPDGRPRRPFEERERRLENCKDELAYIARLTPGRILDVGCGVGYLLSALDPRWERHGTEVSPFAARQASEHAKLHLGPLEAAGYPDGHFDVVVLYHVIEHIADPVSALREAYRILRPGGHMLVGTPDFDSASARRFGENFRMLHDKTHTSLFSCESLRRLLLDTGLCIDHVHFPYFDTQHFSLENLSQLFDVSRISPPFYGNVMTYYCKRPRRSATVEALTLASRAAASVAHDQGRALERALTLITNRAENGATLWVAGDGAVECAHSLCVAGYTAHALEVACELPERRRAGDVLIVNAGHEPPLALLSAARRCQLSSILLCDRSAGEHAADVLIEIDCSDASARRLVQLFLVGALSAGGAPLPLSAAEPRSENPRRPSRRAE